MLLLFRGFVLNQDPAGISSSKPPGQDSRILWISIFKKVTFKIQIFLMVIEKDWFCHLNMFLALTRSIVTFIFIMAGEVLKMINVNVMNFKGIQNSVQFQE